MWSCLVRFPCCKMYGPLDTEDLVETADGARLMNLQYNWLCHSQSIEQECSKTKRIQRLGSSHMFDSSDIHRAVSKVTGQDRPDQPLTSSPWTGSGKARVR